MNKTAEVIIIGGGVVGCAAAYYLAKKGVKDVIVLEADKSIGHGGHQETVVVSVSQDVISENFLMPCMRFRICGHICQRNLV